uniref:Uncharacterized protein n=1 Tax=Anopheles atroparvus TaxID=41427 RepID=A0AAG5DC52_ANOAO
MENKYKAVLANMNDQKNEMQLLHCYQFAEKSTEPASFHWVTVHRNLDALLERINATHLKAKQLQHATPATEKDTLNLIKMLELIHAILIDYSKIYKEQAWRDSKFENKSGAFGNQMVKVKQQIDLISFEVTKLKTVSESLENIVSNYKMELSTASSDQENEEEDQNAVQNNVSLQ